MAAVPPQEPSEPPSDGPGRAWPPWVLADFHRWLETSPAGPEPAVWHPQGPEPVRRARGLLLQ
jgi:hypothetical protein